MPKNSILIADDDEHVRKGLSSFLRKQDYEVETVDSGEACVRAIQTRRFDLLFLDLKLGGADGFEVLHAIRADVPETFIFMLSAFDEPSTRQRAAQLGADGFIGKTFEPREMNDRVKLALSEADHRVRRRLAQEEAGLYVCRRQRRADRTFGQHRGGPDSRRSFHFKSGGCCRRPR